MAVWTIAGLTLREAARRRTLVGVLLLGLLLLAFSLLLILVRLRFQQLAATYARPPGWFATTYPIARSLFTTLCLASIRTLSSIFAILLAGGAISGEIDRGVMTVLVTRPIARWEILVGKWIGINVILTGAVLFWTLLVWASFTMQTGMNLTALLTAGLLSTLFPLVVSTVTLALATVSHRLMSASLALGLTAFSWFDGILNAMGMNFEVDALRRIASVAGVLMPQGCIAWWIKRVMEPITVSPQRAFLEIGVSPEPVREWGLAHLGIPHLDVLYLGIYVLAALGIGLALFERRDI